MEQILKGWIIVNDDYWQDEDEIYLVKNDRKEVTDNDVDRQLRLLITNALEKLGSEDLSTEDDYESGVSGKYEVENIKLQLFAATERMKLDQIKENVLLDSMGLLEFQENWYGYSTWTIEGFNTQTFTLGGHDVLEILRQHEGKFIYLVIDKVG